MKHVLVLLTIFLFSVQLFAQMSDETRVSTEKTAADYVNDLDSSDPKVVVDAIKWLGDKEQKDSAPKIMGHIASSDADVRMWSAVTLGRFFHKEARDPIINQLMAETNPDVRYAQVISVTRIGLENNDETRAKLRQLRERETDPFIVDYIKKMEEKYGGGSSSTSGTAE